MFCLVWPPIRESPATLMGIMVARWPRMSDCGANALFSVPRRHLARLAVLALATLTSSCIHRTLGLAAPPFTVSNLKVSERITVGQILYADIGDNLTLGPNLGNMGLIVHTTPIDSLSVNQPDITLAELLNVAGASQSSCEPPPQNLGGHKPSEWYEAEQAAVVGDHASFLFTDTIDERADVQSLAHLFRDERLRRPSFVPWSNVPLVQARNKTPAIIATEASSAKGVTLRFAVRAKADLPQSVARFGAPGTSDVHDTSATLMKIVQACSPDPVRARNLSDDRIEFVANHTTRTATGFSFAVFDGPDIKAMTEVNALTRLYQGARLPTPSTSAMRKDVKDLKGIWTKNLGNITTFLAEAKDQPQDMSTVFEYCRSSDCDAVITPPREFTPKGAPYAAPDACFVMRSAGRSPLERFFANLLIRKVSLRELIVFFGSSELPMNFQPALPSAGVGYDDFANVVSPYTSQWVQKVLSSSAVPANDPKSPSQAIWVYEYDCDGGFPQRRVPPTPARLHANDHLKGWGLDQDHFH